MIESLSLRLFHFTNWTKCKLLLCRSNAEQRKTAQAFHDVVVMKQETSVMWIVGSGIAHNVAAVKQETRKILSQKQFTTWSGHIVQANRCVSSASTNTAMNTTSEYWSPNKSNLNYYAMNTRRKTFRRRNLIRNIVKWSYRSRKQMRLLCFHERWAILSIRLHLAKTNSGMQIYLLARAETSISVASGIMFVSALQLYTELYPTSTRIPSSLRITVWFRRLAYTFMLILHVMELVIVPPVQWPDLFPVLWSIFGCGLIGVVYLWTTYHLSYSYSNSKSFKDKVV